MESAGTPAFPRRNREVFLLAASAVTALVLVFTTVDPWLNRAGILAGGADVHIYRDGALRVLHHIPLYADPTLFGLWYTYTPFSTIVFIPIERIPEPALNNVWLAINLGVLLACVLLCWRTLGYRLSPRLVTAGALLTLTCTFLEPVRTTLFYGQINLVLMLIVLVDLGRDDRSMLRGIGVGIAAGIKLTPGYFVALFLAKRQWRSAVTAVLTFVGSVVFAWLVLPSDSTRYWTSTFFQSTRIAVDTHPSNQCIRGALAHLIGRPAPTWLWVLIAGAVTVVSLHVAAELHRHGERLLAVTLSGLTASAVSPYSWSHHWVWFVPLLVYLLHRALSDARWWLAAAVVFLSAGSWPYAWNETNVVIGLFLFPPAWAVTPAVLMNIYVILYVGVLVGACTALAGIRRAAAADRTGDAPQRDADQLGVPSRLANRT